MKNLLPILALLAVLISACGPSSEEKAAAQEENEAMVNDKVNEIMQDLEQSASESNDSTSQADTVVAE
jgi:hypothetical protein